MDALIVFLEIIFLNLLLSGDNAIVIAMASQNLPPKERKLALWWGAAAAIILRCLLAIAAVSLLQIPYLQAVGALLLIIIAVKLLLDSHTNDFAPAHKQPQTLKQAIISIIAADAIMSLDNVIAIAAAAGGDTVLIMLGIAVSIPIILWGSQLFTIMLKKFPWLAYAGAGLLAFTAGEMFISDKAVSSWQTIHQYSLHELIPLLAVPFVFIAAILKKRTL